MGLPRHAFRGSKAGLQELRFQRSVEAAKPAEWVSSENCMEEKSLLEGLVKNRSKVLCVGAYGSPWGDPTPLWLAQKVRSGNVTIIDVRGGDTRVEHPYSGILGYISNASSGTVREKLRAANEKLAAIGKTSEKIGAGLRALDYDGNDRRRVGYVGGLRPYRSDARRLEPFGFGKTRIRLLPRLAWDTALPSKSLDLIVDRGTWYDYYRENSTQLGKALGHYLELLKPGSKIVFSIGKTEGRITKFSSESLSALRRLLEEKIAEGKIRVEETDIIPSQGKPLWPKGLAIRGYKYASAFVVTKLAERKQ